MMFPTNPSYRYCNDFVHELENSSLSDVLSDWKIQFMFHDDIGVDELRHKVEEMGIEIIGEMDIELDADVNGYCAFSFVTMSTDTEIDKELYAKLYEFSERNDLDITFFIRSNQVSIENGIKVYRYYNELRLDCIESEVTLEIMKDVNPEEWTQIQAELEE